MNQLIQSLFSFYLIVLIGFFCGKILKKYNKSLRKLFTFILIYILTPLLIFFSFLLPNFNFSFLIVLNIILFEVSLVFFSQLFIYFIFLRNRDPSQNKRKGALLMLVAFPNAMLFPLPIVLSVFGTNLVPVLVIFSLSAMVLRGTWLTYLSIYYGEKETDINYKETFKKIITFPPTFALLISILITPFNFPFKISLITVLNDIFSLITTIVGALLIGILLVNIEFSHIKNNKNDFLIVFLMRIGFSLLLFSILSQFLIFPRNIRSTILIVLLLIYIDPPAVTNTAYAEYFELDEKFTAFSVISITIFAMLYIPFFLFLSTYLF